MRGQILRLEYPDDGLFGTRIVAVANDRRSSHALDRKGAGQAPARGAPAAGTDSRWVDALAVLHSLKAHEGGYGAAKSRLIELLRTGKVGSAATRCNVRGRRAGTSADAATQVFTLVTLDSSIWLADAGPIHIDTDGKWTIQTHEGPELFLVADSVLLYREDVNAIVNRYGIIFEAKDAGGKPPNVGRWTDIAIALALYDRQFGISSGVTQTHLKQHLSAVFDGMISDTVLDNFAAKVFDEIGPNANIDERFHALMNNGGTA